ncbi:class I SAM-dependent methyltransferase [Streptomyces sp. B6B3]|uniref:class I SAM-dependent methyltransferase n=1 Tax=Streptomyces sp. B6B3 TaxID=3153570 RepID=UPI00325CE5FB
MKTSWWSSGEDARTYASLGNPLEWRVAYPELFRRLEFGPQTPGPVLDYGCGPGAVASHVAGRYGYDVVGCDVSGDMIDIARRYVARPGVRFLKLANQRVDGFPASSFGAALCTFVLCVIDDRERHLEIGREIRRLLRPGAPFGLVVPHPDSVGVQFGTCRSGDPRASYAPGDPMTTCLTANDRELVIEDYYWPTEWYAKLLVECGFQDVSCHAPLAGEGEPARAPFLLVTGRK